MAGSGWRRRSTADDAPADPAFPNNASDAQDASPTRIDAGCEIEGQFSLDGPLVVDGEFRGEIRCGGSVTVGEQGSVEANIEARQVCVHGAVAGDIQATREIILQSTARVHGNLRAPSIVVERGAFFQGETTMYRPEHVVQDNALLPPDPPEPPARVAGSR